MQPTASLNANKNKPLKKDYYSSLLKTQPVIRNYLEMIHKPNYIQAEIAECHILQSGEMIAIKKTFWLSIIQRAWRKKWKEHKQNLFCKFRNMFISMNQPKHVNLLQGLLYKVKSAQKPI